MPAVVLDGNEWGQVMAILATAPWKDANPLLMKIGAQLQASADPARMRDAAEQRMRDLQGNGGEEADHG